MHVNHSSEISLAVTDTEMSTNCKNTTNLDDLCEQEDKKIEASVSPVEEKRKAPRIKGWGLRKFSTIVCDKVKEKGRTTYNEVADEIICDLSSMEKKDTKFDEKNIRRRVYDAFNVLMAINVIAKDKKEIIWVGFPCNGLDKLAKTEERRKLLLKIQEKANSLRELENKYRDISNLIRRNQLSHKLGSASSDGIALPFLLVRTNPKATVEIEISEDMRMVNFDFHGAPFHLHDTDSILKAMRCARSSEQDQNLADTLTEQKSQQQQSALVPRD
ncbi:transcription factor-like protein DPB [Zingiber officinale]|uniref:Transcription factor-like protein DPB n=1 Tax=Zingiber officinale TaxID=94328 RepID=A0A8J5GY83_ZINOF|nr:transcription factor-like protein DPB isoform X1 [Zingiber officinale]XP_042397549.1 transcription factor-like protein DPB [Zingiber officinale]KAG6509038.1 hypothetical protein ZIOFF_034427 [Zingiber officinale]